MNILFITANRLGDAVLSTGILGRLIEKYPDAAITVACGPVPAPLFSGIPQVKSVIELTKGPWARHWRQLWMKTVGTHWDMVVDLRQSAVSRLIPARRRFIWRKHKLKVHKITELAATINALPLPAPRLWHTEQSLDYAETLVPKRDFILALAPGANSCGKKWPADRYAELAKELTAPDGLLPNASLLLLGDERDRATIDQVVAGFPPSRVIDLAGTIDIALTAACLARADLYIGNDSGLTHLAAAAGAPTLALFGPGVAWKYRPWGDRAAYVSKADDPTRTFDLCRNGDDEAALDLMKRLTIDDVVEAAEQLWQKTIP